MEWATLILSLRNQSPQTKLKMGSSAWVSCQSANQAFLTHTPASVKSTPCYPHSHDAAFIHFTSPVATHSFATMGKTASWPLSNITVLSLACPWCLHQNSRVTSMVPPIKHSREGFPGKPMTFLKQLPSYKTEVWWVFEFNQKPG